MSNINYKKEYKTKYYFYKRGYTLGLTMVVVSTVLLITLSIYSLMYSEFKVLGIGDKSMRAYYNADIGIECVKFYENQYTEPGSNPNALDSVAAGGVPTTGFFLAAGSNQITYGNNRYRGNIECGGDVEIKSNILNRDNLTGIDPVYVTLPNMPGQFLLTKFKIKNTDLDLCTDVKVYKTLSNINALTVVSTGYSSCSTAGELRISREVVYQRGFNN